MRRWTIIITLCILTVTMSASAFAQGKGKRGGLQRVNMMKSELNLTDEQYDQIKTLTVEREKKAIDLRSQTELLQLELEEIMTADKPSKSAALKKVEQIGVVRTELQKLRVGYRIDLKNVLTPEQIEKMQELRLERRKDRPRGFRGGSPGDRQRQNYCPNRQNN